MISDDCARISADEAIKGIQQAIDRLSLDLDVRFSTINDISEINDMTGYWGGRHSPEQKSE